jgi:hypothetical protein
MCCILTFLGLVAYVTQDVYRGTGAISTIAVSYSAISGAEILAYRNKGYSNLFRPCCCVSGTGHPWQRWKYPLGASLQPVVLAYLQGLVAYVTQEDYRVLVYAPLARATGAPTAL